MKWLVLAAALVALAPTIVLAQERRSPPDSGSHQRNERPDYGPWTGDWELTLAGSGSSDNEFDNNTLGATAGLGYYLTPGWEVGIRQSANWSDPKRGGDKLNGSTRGFVDYNFNLGRFRPYLGINLGGTYGDGIQDSFAAGPEGGIKYYADYRTFVYAGAEYQILFTDFEDVDNKLDNGNLIYTIGIGFNF